MRDVAIAGVLLIGMARLLVAQDSQTRPAFEVASIRQSDSLERGGRSGWDVLVIDQVERPAED